MNRVSPLESGSRLIDSQQHTQAFPNAKVGGDPQKVYRDIRGTGGKLLFRIRPETLRRVEQLVRGSTNPGPFPGAEIGGVVIGTRQAESGVIETVTDFVPVGIRYQSGPRYRPTLEDKLAFDQVLADYPAEGESQVVACFRTNLGDARVREEDSLLLQHLFPAGMRCLLLIHAGTFRWSVRNFYTRASGREVRESHEISMADILQAHAEMNQDRLMEPAPEALLLAPILPPRLVGPALLEASSMPFSEIHFRKQGLLVALAILLVSVATFAGGRFTASAKRVAEIPIGLSVQGRGGAVELKWNAASRVVRNAVRGSLVIVDSEDANRVELSADQLRRGKFEYQAHGSNLTFQMMFHQPDNSFVGSSSSYHAEVPPSIVDATLAAKGNIGARAGFGNGQAALPAHAPASVAPAPFVPPPARAVRVPAIGIESLPALDGAPQLNATFIPSSPVASSPPVVAPPPIVSSSPVAPSEPKKAPAPPVVFFDPVIIKRVAPTIPRDLLPMLGKQVFIRVVMDIDIHGKVTAVRTPDGKGSIEKALARQAAQAARMWEFKPALRNGTPVASQMVAQFQFVK